MKSDHRNHFLVFFLLLGLYIRCGSLAAMDTVPEALPPANEEVARLREHIQHLLLEKIDPATACCRLDRERLEVFYHQHGDLPVWWDLITKQRKPAARQLLELIGLSAQHGLNPADYQYDALLRLWPGQSSAEIAQLDLLLTDAFFDYSRHLYSGRYAPGQLDPNWHIEPELMDATVFLDRVIDSPDFRRQVEALAPPHNGYRLLQQSLARYRQLAAAEPWPVIGGGPLLRVGDHDPRVKDLRLRLQREGYLGDMPSEDGFMLDEVVEQAVKHFQELHGIKVDGVVGPHTLAALNVAPEQRIQQILLNMERWRWLPRQLGRRYLMVNMAGFSLQAIEKDQVQLDMRVIIGKPYRSTPAFFSMLTYLVVNPYWNVPDIIVREDLIPLQRRNPDYLQSHGIRILDGWQADAQEIDPASIDWQRVNPKRFHYRLRQDPGPDNSLGRVKFMLPNEYDVYLHDTPARHLFEETVRTFSSGCIRLEHPLQLAGYVLAGSEEWDGSRVQAQMESGENRTLILPEPLPVYLLYWTAWVDGRGDAHFVNDVYGLDERMAEVSIKQ